MHRTLGGLTVPCRRQRPLDRVLVDRRSPGPHVQSEPYAGHAASDDRTLAVGKLRATARLARFRRVTLSACRGRTGSPHTPGCLPRHDLTISSSSGRAFDPFLPLPSQVGVIGVRRARGVLFRCPVSEGDRRVGGLADEAHLVELGPSRNEEQCAGLVALTRFEVAARVVVVLTRCKRPFADESRRCPRRCRTRQSGGRARSPCRSLPQASGAIFVAGRGDTIRSTSDVIRLPDHVCGIRSPPSSTTAGHHVAAVNYYVPQRVTGLLPGFAKQIRTPAQINKEPAKREAHRSAKMPHALWLCT